MLHLITGGSGSGKSAYAEEVVKKAGKRKRIYIATMIPYGEDARQRIERHRQLRREKQFETVECYSNLASLEIPEDSVVLLECMSNLIANELYEPDGAHENTKAAVLAGVLHLIQHAHEVVLVTNEVFSDGIIYDASTVRYLECLGEVNQALAVMADQVTEVVCGIPIQIKRQR